MPRINRNLLSKRPHVLTSRSVTLAYWYTTWAIAVLNLYPNIVQYYYVPLKSLLLLKPSTMLWAINNHASCFDGPVLFMHICLKVLDVAIQLCFLSFCGNVFLTMCADRATMFHASNDLSAICHRPALLLAPPLRYNFVVLLRHSLSFFLYDMVEYMACMHCFPLKSLKRWQLVCQYLGGDYFFFFL